MVSSRKLASIIIDLKYLNYRMRRMSLRLRYLVLLASFVLCQSGLVLHEINVEHDDHLGQAHCELCLSANSFEDISNGTTNVLLTVVHSTQAPIHFEKHHFQSAFYPSYHSRAPPWA